MTHTEEPDDRGPPTGAVPDGCVERSGTAAAGPAEDVEAERRADDEALEQADPEQADAEQADPEQADPEQAAQRWVEDLVERGEAVPEGEGTDLPPGTTHEVVEGDDGPTRVRRRRFPIT